MMLQGQATLGKEQVNEEISMKARDFGTGIIDLTLESDPKIDMLFLQVVLEDRIKTEDGRWKSKAVIHGL